MLVAVFLLHIQNGFFMNWGGTQAGEGFELHLLVLAMTALLMWKGSGAWSLDAVLARRIQAAPTQPRRAEAGAPARAA